MQKRAFPCRNHCRLISRPLRVAIAVAMAMAVASRAHAVDGEPLQFSAGFLIGGKAIDMQRYAQGLCAGQSDGAG